MPSTLPGFQSGGQPLTSGNPFSGTQFPFGGVTLYNATDSSGVVYAGVLLGRTSGGVTITSGGAFSSGGMNDGQPIAPGASLTIPALFCSGQVDKIALAVPAAVSGRCRVFWGGF